MTLCYWVTWGYVSDPDKSNYRFKRFTDLDIAMKFAKEYSEYADLRVRLLMLSEKEIK